VVADLSLDKVMLQDVLQAREAIPELTLLLNDPHRSHVDDLIPVAEAARRAIATLEAHRP
jgi:hypothetical protein